jgi:hypothetical protein
MIQACSFKLAHYKETLAAYQNGGYVVCSFRDWHERRPALVLRHDIDFDDNSMTRMADIEQQAGATATYLIRMHGKYNPFSYRWINRVRSLSNLGHEIGLHFEQFNGNPTADYMDTAKRLFLLLYGIKIERMSQHYAAKDNLDFAWYKGLQDITFHGWKIFNEAIGGKYLSDSAGRWREGCFCNWIGKRELIFVSIHPVWWYSAVPQENF